MADVRATVQEITTASHVPLLWDALFGNSEPIDQLGELGCWGHVISPASFGSCPWSFESSLKIEKPSIRGKRTHFK